MLVVLLLVQYLLELLVRYYLVWFSVKIIWFCDLQHWRYSVPWYEHRSKKGFFSLNIVWRYPLKSAGIQRWPAAIIFYFILHKLNNFSLIYLFCPICFSLSSSLRLLLPRQQDQPLQSLMHPDWLHLLFWLLEFFPWQPQSLYQHRSFSLLLLLMIIYIPIAVKARKSWRAFLASSVAIVSILGLAAISLFPRMVPSCTDLAFSLTVYNASSSQKTLTVMLIIALIGMPLVIGYTWFIYRVFKGKVELTETSYW